MVRLPIPQRLTSHLSTRSNASTPGQSRSTSPMRLPESKPLVLKVSVLRGRNLAPKDRNGRSDPYLIVTLGDARQSTPMIPKTLNPEWNVTFEMPVVGVPLLECICWDHDRFGKDYMGEFDIPLEEIFSPGEVYQQPQWYTLTSKRKTIKKKDSTVSGEILLQFSLIDTSNPTASPTDTYNKYKNLVCAGEEEDDFPQIPPLGLDGVDRDEETSDETDDPSKPEVVEKRRRRLRLARLKRKSIAARAYQFSGAGNGVQGIVFMEIVKVTDLPPERNVTRTSFDMDPFVVTSLGRKTLRTPVIRHNLNPVYNEKMVFQVMKHEQSYTIGFTVMDRDKFSGNDFVASAGFPLQTLVQAAPDADPETGLYKFLDSTLDPTGSEHSGSDNTAGIKIDISPSPSHNSLSNMSNKVRSRSSTASISAQSVQSAHSGQELSTSSPPAIVTEEGSSDSISNAPTMTNNGNYVASSLDSDGLQAYRIPLTLKNKERWEDKHSPLLVVKAKYMPYRALRQQFWRLMLRQYDADDSGRIDKVELTTMLDTLGSTLKESTIDSFFERFSVENEPCETMDLTFDQAVICLEDTLQALQIANRAGPKNHALTSSAISQESEDPSSCDEDIETSAAIPPTTAPQALAVPILASDQLAMDEELEPDDLGDERGEEHVIEIRECPLCHQPRLSKRSDADIITHIATCASRDWRQVDNLVMGGFVTSSQAQRKWYTKVITKISYGGYKLGANSANILVQDRITGQINEERMSVYVRLGIRLLYRGLKSREMEKKRIRKILKSMSVKQGKKYDDPASASQIQDFINFHQLDLSEVLLPLDKFKNFNEFFYRQLKPGARPCSAPNEPRIVVSPADCRSVVFDRMNEATGIWVKGREFSIDRLLGDAYPEDVQRYRNGALGIFRLAPQDYHRFHIPVDGVLGTPKTIGGEYYTVNPMAIRSALDVYGENVRVLVPIDSVAHGRVMVVCVGAMMVGSTVITRQGGEKVSRGDELGYFKFGGSTLLLLFEEGTIKFDSDLVGNSKGPLETLIRVGMSVGHSPDIPQFEPDMPKKPESLTSEDIQAARRRIEGSLAPLADGRFRNSQRSLAPHPTRHYQNNRVLRRLARANPRQPDAGLYALLRKERFSIPQTVYESDLIVSSGRCQLRLVVESAPRTLRHVASPPPFFVTGLADRPSSQLRPREIRAPTTNSSERISTAQNSRLVESFLVVLCFGEVKFVKGYLKKRAAGSSQLLEQRGHSSQYHDCCLETSKEKSAKRLFPTFRQLFELLLLLLPTTPPLSLGPDMIVTVLATTTTKTERRQPLRQIDMVTSQAQARFVSSSSGKHDRIGTRASTRLSLTSQEKEENASRTKRKSSFDEDVDDFQFTRIKPKKAKPTVDAIPEVPQPLPEKSAPQQSPKRGRPPKKRQEPKPDSSGEVQNTIESKPKRQTRGAAKAALVEPETQPASATRSTRKGDHVEPVPKEKKRRKGRPSKSNDEPQQQNGFVSPEPPKAGTATIALPIADTPVMQRNKEMRGQTKSGKGNRRSSLGMRGRRASSLIDSGASNALPHKEVDTADFYKHIASDGLPEPRRMRQLLTWCATRALGEKPSGSSTEDASERLAARVIQEELLKDFSTNSELSNWFAREEVDSPSVVVKKPNPKNVQNTEKIKELEEQIQKLQKQKQALNALLRPPPSPSIKPASKQLDTAQNGQSGPPPSQAESNTNKRARSPEPDPIDLSLLEPSQQQLYALIDPNAATRHPDTELQKAQSSWEPNSLSTVTPSTISTRLSRIAAGLVPTLDSFAAGVHDIELYRAMSDSVSSRVLRICAERLDERDARNSLRRLAIEEEEGDHQNISIRQRPREDLGMILGALSRVERR
ncbi:putative phosphatidylserine decarboxylase Psd2 [Aspergillus tanneri]|uniref:Phosphatidylserine decarboxylase proenzyme 2 n=1 Tax=Aspergillus tanneri TaxID=1220188 RepID=A0A5M9MVJ4_9EURO|nr:uncharacterized protein ATNIH1004_007930 [Aspergillus tanneri]KAA8646497.1 hypothetical protein ATNIH1004_007930 [Aspergillus tanneri]